MDMGRPQRSNQPWLILSDDELDTSLEDAKRTPVRESQDIANIRFHIDNSAWEVIHKEVKDWWGSSWAYMALPAEKTCTLL